jgi:hypothetical protein
VAPLPLLLVPLLLKPGAQQPLRQLVQVLAWPEQQQAAQDHQQQQLQGARQGQLTAAGVATSPALAAVPVDCWQVPAIVTTEP